MRIDIAKMEQAYRELGLGDVETYLQEIEKRIDDVVNEDSYRGQAAQGMKNYLKEVHGMAVKSFLIVIMQVESGMKRFLRNFYQYEGSDNAIIDRDYLIHLQKVADDFRNNIGAEFEEFNQQMNIASQEMELSTTGFYKTRHKLDHVIDQVAKVADDTNHMIHSLNDQHMKNEMEVLNNHVATLETVIKGIDGVVVGGIESFIPGSFANSPLGRELFNHMLGSATTMAQHGSKHAAIEALSILGGYISTLPPHLRKMYESIKGRAIRCAIIGDPVNATTGNFIYDHVDIKVEGRHPLIFERFYNSVDATTTTLGRNWTHSYNIRLIPLEDSGASVVFGDSRQEFYSLDQEAIKSGEVIGVYKSEIGNLNVLRAVRENDKTTGIELVIPDGSKYLFNGKGQLTKQLDQAGNEILFSYDAGQLTKIESLSGYLELAYKGNFIETITDHTGRTISYKYENNLLSTYTDTLGNSLSYEYDLRERLVNIKDFEGNQFVSNVYDEQDRITKQKFADSSKMLYRYNDWKKLTEFTKQNGSKFIYKHDDEYRTTGMIEPDGEIKIEYNENSQRSKYTDKLGDATSFEYDSEKKNNLSSVVNPLGETTEFNYNDSNKLTRIIVGGITKLEARYDSEDKLVTAEDALKRQVRFSYNKETRELPTHIVQPDGSVIKICYDERHNVTQLTNANGVTTNFEYDELNRAVKTIDGNGNITQFNYDSNNNITCITNSEGNSRKFTYNKANKVTNVVIENGAQIKREYNELGKLSKVTDPLGRGTALDYDEMWNCSKVTEANGAQTQFLYNNMNRLESVIKPDANQVSFEYDPNGNRTKIIDEEGNVTNLSYDALGRLIEVCGEEGLKFSYTYNVDGKVTRVTDALDNTVNLEYDDAGQLIKETNALGDVRVYTYTSLGKIETVTDEASRVTRYDYEPGGRLKAITHPDGNDETFEYDGNNNVVSHTNKSGQTVEYIYDSLNRVVAIKANGGTRVYTYDPVGNVVSFVDELGNATNYEYSLTGRIMKVTDALENETHYSYDLVDNLIEVRQEGEELNDNQELRITKYERNIMGQIKLVEDALGNKETYAYSAKGQITGKLDKDGFITKYAYTAEGDLNHIQYEDGREVTMSYNALRHLTEINDWLGTTQIETDAIGRTTRVSNHNDQVIEYVYGSAGERKQVTYPSGNTVGYEYDSALRLMKISDMDQEINYSYDQLGRLIGKQFGSGVGTTYAYDGLGRLSELKHLSGKDILDSYKYSYDVLGNRIQIEKARQGIEADSGLFNYEYDSLNRLQSVAKDGNPLRSYSFDSFGNRISMIDGGKETNYQFNSINQLIASTDSEGFSQHFNYDKRGNMIEAYKNDDLVNKHHFGSINRLESGYNFEKSLGAIYSYNGFGNRVGIVEGKPLPETTSLEKIVLDPARQVDDVIDITRQYNNLLERNENSQEISYLYDSGVLSASFKGHKLNYLADNLGSTVRLMHSTGAEVDVFGYDEYGRSVTDHAPKTFNTFGFVSHQLDNVTGDYFAQARQYDPTTGRFTSQDLIKGFTHAPITHNQYTYCWHQPLKFVDLNGMYPEDPEELPYAHLDPNYYCQRDGRMNGRSEFGFPSIDWSDQWERSWLSSVGDWWSDQWDRSLTRQMGNSARDWVSDRRDDVVSFWDSTAAPTVNAVFCSITVELEHGIGFGGDLLIGNFELGGRAAVSDHYRIRPGRPIEVDHEIWQIGIDVDETITGVGFGFGRTFTEESGWQTQFGPRLNNVEAHRQNNDLVIGVGINAYFLIGGGGDIQINLSEVGRRAYENEDGLFQACEP